MNGDRFVQPEYQVGAQFLNVEFPERNALERGITGEAPATIYGTDPANFAREAVFGIPESVKEGAATVGRAVAGSVLALIVIAVGLLILVKQ